MLYHHQLPVVLIKKFGIAKSEPPSYHRLLHDRISIQRSHFDEGIHSFLTDLVVSRTGRVILALGAEILRLLQTRPYLLVRDCTYLHLLFPHVRNLLSHTG
jgi:hypothetical protein